MKFFSQAKGILGMNARNLHYVGRYNTQESKKFADNKLYTKNFLMTRGIGVAKVYLVIKKYKELSQVNPKTLPQSFVIKPNRGFGGEGIMVIKEHKANKFTDVNGNEYTWKDLYHHMVSILDGKYAISGLFDTILIEELLENHEYFGRFVERGLPDIRIIVFNYVPIIAMLRLPTEESEGKANLHLGAVGVGVDIANGKATYAVQNNKFVRTLPNGERVSEIELPMWDEILTMATKAQQASQIKFLAVDIVLTKTGIKILELNARAGLGVQIANQIPLKHRLRKVEDLKVTNPEKGVEVSKALFSSLAEKTEKTETVGGKKVIGLFEKIDILNTSYTNVPTKIDPHTSHVLFDESLTEISSRKRYIDVVLRGERIRFPFKKDNIKGDHKVVIGGKILKNFLIDPSIDLDSQKEEKGESDTTKKVKEKIITNVDKKLTEIDKHLNVLSFVKPINLIEEKERFLANPNYSPQFIYKKPEVDLEHILRDVSSLPRDIEHPLADLFVSKIDEIISKMHLIDSVGTDGFTHASEDLYGEVDKHLYNQAIQHLKTLEIEEDKSKILSTKQIVKRIEHFLEAHKLVGWKVKISEKQTSDIAINKNGSILLQEGIRFSENRLKAVIAHEICTHVYRYENGVMQKYKIFAQGTPHYLQTEEGLAIYNQKTIGVPLGEKDMWAALRVISAYKAKEMSFKELFVYLKYEYDLDDESAWKSCVRAKRGMTDTSKYGAFTRDIIYFKGYLEVKSYIEKHGRRGVKELYTGKISIDDLVYLENLGEYKVKYLPPERIEI